MLSRKQQSRGFLIGSLIYFAWHAAAEWAKLLVPFLQWDAHTTMLQISVVYAVGNFCTFLGTFIVGHLMDTSGARTAGTLAAGLTFVFYWASSRAQSFWGFVAVQPLKTTFCLNQVVETYLASVTDETERTRSVMRLSIAAGFAAVAGPWLASRTAVFFDIRGSVFGAGLFLLVVCVPLLLFCLPDPSNAPSPLSKRPRMLRVADYQDILSSRSLRTTLGLRFLIDGPFMAFDTLSRQHIIGYMMGTYADMSYLFVIIGFTTIFTNVVLLPLLQARCQPRQLLQVGLAVSFVAYVGISFASQFYHFLIFMPLDVVGISIVYAEFASQTASCVEKNNVGKALGLGHAVNLASSTLFALLAGYFVSEFNFSVWCYMAAFVSVLVGVLLQYHGAYMNTHAKNLPSQMDYNSLSR